MIVCTKSSDTITRKAFGREQVSIASFDMIVNQLSLDPTLSHPVRDAYIVTSDDVKNNKTRQALLNALPTKHPKARLIFVNKNSKPVFGNDVMGFDAILERPKSTDISNKISGIISTDSIGSVADIKEQAITEIPEFNPMDESMINAQQEPEERYDTLNKMEQPLPVPEPVPEPEPIQEPVTERESELIERIKASDAVKDISILSREIKAATLIKDMIDSNSDYAAIEEKLKGLNDSIFLIMSDRTITTLEEKLSRARALMHDKNYFAAKGDTLLEQRLEDVIDTILSKTNELINERLSEIDNAIKKIKTSKEIDTGNARLVGLSEERNNLIMELTVLEAEIIRIHGSVDSAIMDVSGSIAERSLNITDNPLLNEQIKARGGIIKSSESVAAIRTMLDMSGDKVNDEFKQLQLKVVSQRKLLNRILDLDKEIIAAQQSMINFMKARNIEDTVIAKSLIKKSLRVFIAEEGVGRTIIPYLLSYYKSRQNANVLLMDITGTGKYNGYEVMVMKPETFINDLTQQEFLCVSGEVNNTVAMAQRIVTTLTKAADYYRVINVVMRPDQVELFETIAQDVLCVNYITDISPANIEKTRGVMERTRMTNVAQRVILNKCDIPLRPIVSMLGLDDIIDVQICAIPTIPAITDANINRYNPYGISSVSLLIEDTLKYA